MPEKTQDPMYVNYLLGNEPLLRARKLFFLSISSALRDLLRSSHVQHLTDIANRPGHEVEEQEIVYDERYGWMAVKENEHRHFRLSIWQAGSKLRVGLRVQASFLLRDAPLDSMLQEVFPGLEPHRISRGDSLLYDWHFDVPHLYTDLIEQETYILSVVSLYENAYHIFQRSNL